MDFSEMGNQSECVTVKLCTRFFYDKAHKEITILLIKIIKILHISKKSSNFAAQKCFGYG